MAKSQGRHLQRRLTFAEIKHAKPGFHADGSGLYLRVDPTGAKRWVQRIVIDGKRRDIAMGGVGQDIAKVRALAEENQSIARKGRDPIAERRKREAAERIENEAHTFEQVARLLHTRDLPTWKNPKHAAQWLSTMEKYVFDKFGAIKIADVTKDHVEAALEPVWLRLPETARRVRQRIGAVMKFAIAKDWRTDNPAEHVEKLLAKQNAQVEHHRALPYKEVGAAIAKVRKSKASFATKLAFEFLVLTATRSGETRGAVWSEIDLVNATWTIPKERMKAKVEHCVPLTPRCIVILKVAKALKDAHSDYVFPGNKSGKPLSDVTLSKLIRELGIDAVPHGFRSSFRDWIAEETDFDGAIAEMALAHTIGNKVESAYRRGNMLEKRRTLMEAWANYVRLTGWHNPTQ